MSSLGTTDIPGADACVFCSIARGQQTPDVVAHRDDHVVVFPSLDQRPENRGHMLVVPVAHVPYIYDLDRGLGGALMESVGAVARAVKRVWKADGITIRQNNEPAGGQDVFHLHFHVVPRFTGDRFHEGGNRFPYGVVEVPHDERVGQAQDLAAELRREREEQDEGS